MKSIVKKSSQPEILGTPNFNTNVYPPISKALLIWSIGGFFYLYEYVLRVSPSVMTNELMAHFGVTSTSLGILASFYYYSYVLLQLPGGIIVDRVGPRAIITLSAALCAFGAYLFAISETLSAAQLGRFLIGAGSACAFLSSMKLSAEWFHPNRFALLCGIIQAMGTLGGTFGGKPFAKLINYTSWQTGMIYCALIGVGVTIISWVFIRNRPPEHMSFHKNSTLSKNTDFLHSLKIIASNPKNWVIGAYGGFMYILISAFTELWGVPFIMEQYRVNNEMASSSITMLFIGYAIGCPLWAVYSNYLNSRRKVMLLSTFTSLFVFLIIIYVPISLSLMYGLLFVAGLVCSGQTLYFAAAKDINPPHLSGTCVGFINFFVMMSGVVFQPAMGKVLDLAWEGHMQSDAITRQYSPNSFKWALTVIPVCLIISWVIMYFYSENKSVNLEK